MQKPLVSLIVLSYNSERHLPALFSSLKKQTYEFMEYIVVDNNSQDSTVKWIKHQEILSIDILIENLTNDWYAKGNNRGVDRAHGEYIVFCNDDVVLKPDFIEVLMQQVNSDSSIGMIGGKLLKLMPEEVGQKIIEPWNVSAFESNIGRKIDSAGIIMQRNRQVINRGENQIDDGQFNKREDIFGITGALMLVSRAALEKTKYGNEYFDEAFEAYKEDVDLSWRMQRAGFRVIYEPQAVAYHARSIQSQRLAERSSKPKLIRAISYRNHIWTIYKNSVRSEILRDFPWIISYEVGKLIYILLFEWSTLRQIPCLLRGLSIMKKKRIVATENYSIKKWIK